MAGHVTALPDPEAPPAVGTIVRHADTGIVGFVQRVYAAGEHPAASCEVVRLSTGDELVWKPESFTALSAAEALVYRTLEAAFRGIVGSTLELARKTGLDPFRVALLLRSALSEALRPRPAQPPEASR